MQNGQLELVQEVHTILFHPDYALTISYTKRDVEVWKFYHYYLMGHSDVEFLQLNIPYRATVWELLGDGEDADDAEVTTIEGQVYRYKQNGKLKVFVCPSGTAVKVYDEDEEDEYTVWLLKLHNNGKLKPAPDKQY